jgi:3-phosphoshikimate 1-carboxyvinyltransferase
MAPLFKGDKKLIITESSHSQAYIEMTVHLLNHLGIETSSMNEGNGLCITIKGDYRSSNTPINLEILESDWSSAAFFYPLLLGMSKDASIELLGLKMSDSQKTQDLSIEGSQIKSSQGDSAMCVFGNLLGIETIKTEKGILINRHPIEINQTLAFLADDEIIAHDQTLRIDLKNNPDLVPALVVGWCILGKSAIISGIHNLRFKECDRILAIQENIKGLGCTLTMLGSVEDDRWILNCSGRFFPAQLHIHTQSDHRIAMAFSALKPWIDALSYTDTTCVEKSFPQFWEQLKKCTFD